MSPTKEWKRLGFCLFLYNIAKHSCEGQIGMLDYEKTFRATYWDCMLTYY